jgi:hypothetical protein
MKGVAMRRGLSIITRELRRLPGLTDPGQVADSTDPTTSATRHTTPRGRILSRQHPVTDDTTAAFEFDDEAVQP